MRKLQSPRQYTLADLLFISGAFLCASVVLFLFYLLAQDPMMQMIYLVSALTCISFAVVFWKKSRKKRVEVGVAVWALLVLFAVFLHNLNIWDVKPAKAQPVASVEEVHFDDSLTVWERFAYTFTKPIGDFFFYPVHLPMQERFSTQAPLLWMGHEFLQDMGGIPVAVSTEDGEKLDAIVLTPERYRDRREFTFDKWSRRFESEPQAAAKLEINSDAQDLEGMLRLPQFSSHSPLTQGVVICMGVGNHYEMRPALAAMYLMRGQSVLMFNYRGIGYSTGRPSWKGTSIDAASATAFLKDALETTNDQILVHGYSLGGGPATYAAVVNEGANLLLDRTFCRMSVVADEKLHPAWRFLSPFFHNLVEQHYRYPNEDWISAVKGRVCIFQAKEDAYIHERNAERLFSALAYAKLGRNPNGKELSQLYHKSWKSVFGGHSTKYNPELKLTWITDKESQEALSAFMED